MIAAGLRRCCLLSRGGGGGGGGTRRGAASGGGRGRLAAAPPPPPPLRQQPSKRPRAPAAAAFSTRGAPPPMPVVHHPLYSAPRLAPGHQFPMQVFDAIHARLLRLGMVLPSQVAVPQRLPSDAELAVVHDPEYVAAFSSCSLDDARIRRIGFREATSTPLLVERTKAEVAGTLLTAELALARGLACNTAGGTHHAHRDYGSGYCILNDLSFAAHELLRRGAVARVLILDLDVHQGDGTATICAGNPAIFTLSVHCESNFPARKARSTLDVGLPDGAGDEPYLRAVSDALPGALEDFRPDLVLYDAGVDVHAADALGRLCVTDAGLLRRELLVLDTCLGAGVPVAGYVGGGYADDLEVLAARHCALHEAALRMYRDHGL
ncbi:histone deacetylase [Raphidocelis subcapitata]|uniref:Histone deacetylase n=1 Tax=Raphidocelis subcapitata TaxID=307507 RepID=A0A2V0P2Q0_9CHLO|nr:histone deacetylase [Raphidocelis subcapitata]|eukprot:GBF94126.1 histone deacetylase [Raphidocelis subcapitata]